MANTRGVGKPFIPTDEQRKEAVKQLNRGMNFAKCCLRIINPEDGLPISVKTFKKAFPTEIREAMVDNLGDAVDCLAAAAKTDPEWAARYINLKGKGYFKERLILKGNPEEQINQLLKSFTKGKINADEMLAAAQIVKQQYEMKLREAHSVMEAVIGKEGADKIFGEQENASAPR